jgi:ribose 5-phosphate isomerase B
MKVVLASDHRGLAMKDTAKKVLDHFKVPYEDLGCFSKDAVDYPDYAKLACDYINQGKADKAILTCGTGHGMAIAANKIANIRAIACGDEHTVTRCRAQKDVNVLCFGEDWSQNLLHDIIKSFLFTTYEGERERHQRRLSKISELEKISKEN